MELTASTSPSTGYPTRESKKTGTVQTGLPITSSPPCPSIERNTFAKSSVPASSWICIRGARSCAQGFGQSWTLCLSWSSRTAFCQPAKGRQGKMWMRLRTRQQENVSRECLSPPASKLKLNLIDSTPQQSSRGCQSAIRTMWKWIWQAQFQWSLSKTIRILSENRPGEQSRSMFNRQLKRIFGSSSSVPLLKEEEWL